MCRHLAYLGPPITLADFVLYQPHSLVHQSFAPNDMRGGGTINADGFGIGWLAADPGESPLARRYRRDRPVWSDASLPDLAASISSGAIVAAVRSATAGMPVTETACAPFVEASWMFSHNGVIDGWPATVAPLADALPPAHLMTMEAPTDSAFLWVLVRQQLREGRSAATALTVVVDQVLALAPGSRLNLLLHEGLHIAATTVGHSLWVRAGEDSVTVSSEPLDPAQRWQPVPDLSLLEATASQYTITPRDQG
ncbi:MAG TPA: ergothioneine biosynthesis protein EgtC [Dermatophilaceae bacterium]|nr:ergothioneine biosynthesis protein EgtC [Dermatophilaceae bacterium]